MSLLLRSLPSLRIPALNRNDFFVHNANEFFVQTNALRSLAAAERRTYFQLSREFGDRSLSALSGKNGNHRSLGDSLLSLRTGSSRRPVFVMQARGKGFAEMFLKKKKPVRSYPPLKKGEVSPKLPVPAHILKPSYADTGMQPPWNDSFQIQRTEEERESMREAGRLAARVRDAAGEMVRPGITTDAIDKFVHQMIIDSGAYPSPLNYGSFPKSVCTSVNECVCHGIPDSRPLQDGDIVNIDVTVYLNGFHGDTSKTFFCGNVNDEAKKLVNVTREALDAAIAICKPGGEFKNIGKIIHEIADQHGYGVVRKFVGHGVGRVFHSGPTVLHYRNSEPGVMQVGQTFTIEPMLTVGSPSCLMWDDDWTVVTSDGSLSAQFEHTLMIKDGGVEILTL